ncbi:MAG: hypothetical protein ACI8P9_000645 [Parasphingorhabdus sp.]|jgi:hypothetical protein
MTRQNKDRFEFEDDWISRQYQRQSSQMPSEDLDNAILARAVQAVEKPRKGVTPFGGRWRVPAALAATVIMAVTLVPELYKQSTPMAEFDLDSTIRLQEPAPMAASPSAASDQAEAEQVGNLREAVSVESSLEESSVERKLSDQNVLQKTQLTSPVASAKLAEPVFESSPATLSFYPTAPKMKKERVPQSITALKKKVPVATELPSSVSARKRIKTDEEITLVWYEEIKRLIEVRKFAEANRQLLLLKKVNPDYQLPKDLLKILNEGLIMAPKQ